MNIIFEKTAEQLRKEDIERQALEAAAKHIESQTYLSDAYQKAQKAFARAIRNLKL
jgi:hypothetical protein